MNSDILVQNPNDDDDEPYVHPQNSFNKSSQGTDTQPESLISSKDGQYYIGPNGAIYRHFTSQKDKLIIAPKSIALSPDQKHRSADTRLKRDKLTRLETLILMRDAIKEVLVLQKHYSGATDGNIEDLPWAKIQAELKELHEFFVKKFGPIHKIEIKSTGILDENGERLTFRAQPNLKKFRKDPDAAKLALLEVYDEISGAAKPGPIFERRLVAPIGEKPDIKNHEQALIYCGKELGKVDFEYMAELLDQNKDYGAIIKEDLIKKGLVYLNPNTKDWESKDDYCAGDVRDKLRKAKKAAENNPEYHRNVTALEAVQPAAITIEEIDLDLSMPWIPERIIKKFAIDVLGAGHDFEITKVASSHSTFIHGDIKDEKKGYFEYGTTIKSAVDLLQMSLNGNRVKVPKDVHKDVNQAKSDREIRAIEKANEMAVAHEKQEKIERAFKIWLYENPDIRGDVERLYNDQFNANVKRVFSNDDMTFPGMTVAGGFKLRPHQSNVVLRNSQGGNTLYAHEVGAGKTYASIAAAMEMKRLGRITKPIFVVPNHMLEQFSGDATRLYPDSNILVLSEDQFHSDEGGQFPRHEKMQLFVKRVNEYPWDAVFMTQSNFDRLRASPITKLQMILDDLNEVKKLLDRAKSKDNRKKQKLPDDEQEYYQSDAVTHLETLYEKQKSRLIDFLSVDVDDLDRKKIKVRKVSGDDDAIDYLELFWAQVIEPNISKKGSDKVWEEYIERIEQDYPDPVEPYFEDLDIDYLFIDEGHGYKNGEIKSKNAQLSRKASARARHLRQKLYHLNKKNPGFCISLMTATPISNSISEIYTMTEYMRPDLLRSLGIQTFDAFVSMFAESVTGIEMAPEGGYYRTKERVSSYKNVPELISIFHQFADVVLGEMLDLNIPSIKDGQAQTVVVPRNGKLNNFFLSLGKRADLVRNEGDFWEEFSATLEAEDLEEIEQFIKNRVAGYYPENEVSDKKVAFDSVATAKKPEDKAEEEKPSDNILKIIMDGRLASLHPSLVDIDDDDHPDGKVEALVKEVASRYQENKNRIYHDNETGEPDPVTGSLQMVFCDLGVPGGNNSFSVYDEIKRQLVAKGLPADSVRFIHDYGSDKKKAELFQECRDGHVSVILGTTEKLGTGTNVQKRLIAVHELDAPWRPTDVIQRIGRILRQLNQNPEVEILRYVVEKSYDVYLWQTLERKARFINQIIRGDPEMRKFNEGADFSEECAAIKMVAANDPAVFEKAEIDHKIKSLRDKQKTYEYEREKARHNISTLNKEIRTLKSALQNMQDTAEKLVSPRRKSYPLELHGYEKFNNATEAGICLKEVLRAVRVALRKKDEARQLTKEVGTIFGLPLKVTASVDISEKPAKEGEGSVKSYKYNLRLIAPDGLESAAIYSGNDIRETKKEREIRKAAEGGNSGKNEDSDTDKKDLIASFGDVTKLESDIQEIYAELANRIAAPYININDETKRAQAELEQLTAKKQNWEDIKNAPFEWQEELDDLEKQQAKLERFLTTRVPNDNRRSAEENRINPYKNSKKRDGPP